MTQMEWAPERAEMRRLTAAENYMVEMELESTVTAVKRGAVQLRLAQAADWLVDDRWWLG